MSYPSQSDVADGNSWTTCAPTPWASDPNPPQFMAARSSIILNWASLATGQGASPSADSHACMGKDQRKAGARWTSTTCKNFKVKLSTKHYKRASPISSSFVHILFIFSHTSFLRMRDGRLSWPIPRNPNPFAVE